MKEHDGELERKLTVAMTRVEAPDGFLAKVMDAAANSESARSVPEGAAGRLLKFPQRYRWVGRVAASFLLVGLLFGGLEHHRTTERQRAERDFAHTLEITDRAMEHTRQELQRAGVALDE